MTDPRQVLAEIQQRAEMATPGPWHWVDPDTDHAYDGSDPGRCSFCGECDDSPDRLSLRTIQEYPTESVGPLPKFVISEAEEFESMDDVDFIAHSRTDVPRLVAALLKVLDLLESRKHDNCEDGWYSCSQATDPWDGHPSCLDPDREGKPCDCGRDWLIEAANKTITEALGGGA